MKNGKVIEMWNKLIGWGTEKSPAILAGVAVAGVAATAYMAYKSGLRAEKVLEHHREEIKLCKPDDKVAKKEVWSETTRQMLPLIVGPTLMGISTILAILGSQSISKRRIAALSAVCTASESTIKTLNEKMVDVLGERKALELKDEVTKEKFRKQGKDATLNGIVLPSGDVPCKDLYTGRTFPCNAQKIHEAALKLSAYLMQEMYVSLNDFYDLLGQEHCKMGDDLGWNVDEVSGGIIPISITATLDQNEVPCLCLDYDVSTRFRGYGRC